MTSSVERFGGIIKKYGDAIKTLNKDFKDLDRRTGRVEKKVEGILDE